MYLKNVALQIEFKFTVKKKKCILLTLIILIYQIIKIIFLYKILKYKYFIIY